MKNKLFAIFVRAVFIWTVTVLSVEIFLIIQHVVEYGFN